MAGSNGNGHVVDEDLVNHDDIPRERWHASAGPTSKRTTDRINRIKEAIEEGNTRATSARLGGIDPSTLSRWMDDHEDFKEIVLEAEAEAENRHVRHIQRAAQSGSVTASIFWLERRRYQDWGRKDKRDLRDVVREVCKNLGLGDDETNEAVAEAERVMGIRSANG